MKFIYKSGLFLLCSIWTSFCFGETINKFRWAADPESGVPSVFQSPEDPTKIIGFEKEIADAIATQLGVESEFHQNSWDGLIPGLNKNLYDAVVNTLVITPERQKNIDFSIPYYITSELLLVNTNNETIHGLEDCKNKNVGTLRNSKAADILNAHKEINTHLYTLELNALTDLGNGRLDAVLIDAPIALYYAGAIPTIKLINKPIGTIIYGIAVKKGNKTFLEAINKAIKELQKSGEIRVILERWGLWNEKMAKHFNDYSASTTAPVEYNKFMASHANPSSFKETLKRYWSFLPILGKGAFVTLKISLTSMLLATFLGLLLALLRIYGPASLSIISKVYIEVVRGTPLLIQLYFIFYGLPSIGIQLKPFTAGMIALGLNYAAFEAENYRAGILAVHKGQMEAARALGMTHIQGLRYIVIPQAFRVMLPPVTNDFISLLKDSSLVSVITIVDLTYAYSLLATTYYSYFEIGLLVAFIYLALGLPFVFLGKWAEKRLSVNHQASKANNKR